MNTTRVMGRNELVKYNLPGFTAFTLHPISSPRERIWSLILCEGRSTNSSAAYHKIRLKW